MLARILVLFFIILILLLNNPVLFAAEEQDQRLEELEAKFEAMQTAYEARIKALEGRVKELEGEQPSNLLIPEKESDTISIQDQEREDLEETQQMYAVSSSDSYKTQQDIYEIEMEKVRNELGLTTKNFEFHGYLRSGYGINGRGNTMTPFQAPSSPAKYRLGNEAETYLETNFLAKMPEEMTGKGVTFDTQIRLAFVLPHDQTNSSSTETSLRESYAVARGIFEDNPTTAFWAGQRFYSRYDIHMNDFFYRDLSGFGGGIEDVSIFDDQARFSLAWIGGSVDTLDSSGSQFDPDSYQLNMNTIDLGITDIEWGGGKLSFFGTFSNFNGDAIQNPAVQTLQALNLQNSSGFAGSVFYDFPLNEKISNLVTFQYGTGAASNFRALMVPPLGLNVTASDTQINTSDFSRLRIMDSLILNEGEPVSFLALLAYEQGDYGVAGPSKTRWASAGFRPIYHFNRYMSLAFEGGIDYTENDRGTNGTLLKLTLAPQLQPENKALSRPSIRAFLTYAWWANNFTGSVGGTDYIDDTSGLSAGVQLETWF